MAQAVDHQMKPVMYFAGKLEEVRDFLPEGAIK